MNRTAGIVALSAALALSAVAPARAAGPGDGAFNFRMGGFFPTGDGAFWEANEEAFTLDHSDFNSLIGGVGYTASLNNFVEFGLGIDFYYASVRAADRNFVDQDGFAILHDSRLSIVPMTVDLKFLPAGRYKRRGPDGRNFVRRPAFYVGGGIGLDYWQYEEEGDFVASDLSIVYDRLKESDIAFEKHLMAGIEFPVSPQWYITVEARQSWAEDTPGGAFSSVNPGELDLGGTSVFVGGSYRF
jgi:hypothetical protein